MNITGCFGYMQSELNNHVKTLVGKVYLPIHFNLKN